MCTSSSSKRTWVSFYVFYGNFIVINKYCYMIYSLINFDFYINIYIYTSIYMSIYLCMYLAYDTMLVYDCREG